VSEPRWKARWVYADQMVWVYAAALLAGLLMLLAWVAAGAVAAWVDGWESADPERRFGAAGRFVVAGSIGFGMAGLSASFAGLHPVLAFIAAAGGAAALVWVARTFAQVEA
jgi:hypothetical protein